jgi:glycosyltransferase involved in cell wall biosynthesis
MIIRKIYRFAAKVITPCKAVMETIVQREGVEVEKVCIIYNAFDSDRLHEDAKVIPESVGKNGFKIGYVGRFSPIKKLEVFLALAKILNEEIPNLHFILVGDGPEKQRICTEIENEELGGFFSLPGFVDNPQAYYRNFDVFILPSETEGFSLALLEAASASVPAIAFDVGGNAEIIIDGVTGLLVPYGNIKLLAAKVLYLHENLGDRINMGKTANAYATRRFSQSVRLQGLHTLYESL